MKNCIKKLVAIITLGILALGIISCTNETETKTVYVEKSYCTPVTFSYENLGEAGVEVTMATATEDASIYYTTNGSEPTAESTAYTNPVTFAEDTTVKAIAVKKGIENSPVSVATVSIAVESIPELGLYEVNDLMQKTTGGKEISDYELRNTIRHYSLRAGFPIAELKNTYEGFTAKAMFLKESVIYIFYDRNTVTYTFQTGSEGKFEDGTTSKEVSGLYDAFYTKPKVQTSRDYSFVKWLDSSENPATAKFGAENKTFTAVWKLKSEYGDADPEGFVKIPAGTFKMGNNQDHYSKPVHTVTISKAFYMCDHEVTREEYLAVMGKCPPFREPPAEGQVESKLPVTEVFWIDTIEYCNKLSMSKNLTPCYTIRDSKNPDDWKEIIGLAWEEITCDFSANGYRLPTEAEWEYAARAGDNTVDELIYSGTSSSSDLQLYAWYRENSYGISHEVKEANYGANDFGLYDMSGNVSEWCWDWFSFYDSADQTDPTIDTQINSNQRIIRGGSYKDNSDNCAVSSRNSCMPNTGFYNMGFRVCRSSSN